MFNLFRKIFVATLTSLKYKMELTVNTIVSPVLQTLLTTLSCM